MVGPNPWYELYLFCFVFLSEQERGLQTERES